MTTRDIPVGSDGKNYGFLRAAPGEIFAGKRAASLNPNAYRNDR
jgi:hypothetical protein